MTERIPSFQPAHDAEPAWPWQDVVTADYRSDDLVWLYDHGAKVIDGPRPFQSSSDPDYYTHWAPCEAPSTKLAAPSANVDLRKIAEQAGISMDLWDMGAASLAYTEGVHGVTREHLERFAALYGFACWNAALEATPPAMHGFVSRSIAKALGGAA